MRKIPFVLLSVAVLLGTNGCMTLDDPAAPNYQIKVVQQRNGAKAIPPECASWVDRAEDPLSNDAYPQFGCATARNLAVMIDDPQDLIDGQDPGKADATVAAKSVESYRNNKTKDLLSNTQSVTTSQ